MNWMRIDAEAVSTRYADDGDWSLPHIVFDLISKSYSKIGGYPDFGSARDLPGNHNVWLIGWSDDPTQPTPVAVLFGKTTNAGIKWTGVATDGVMTNNHQTLQKLAALCSEPFNYAEISGALAKLLIKRHPDLKITDRALVERVLDKPISWCEDGSYIRAIMGEMRKKTLFGNPAPIGIAA